MKRSVAFNGLVAVLLSALLAGALPSLPASAADDSICLPAPSIGYTDVDIASGHRLDIDCLKYWEITAQQGTFEPKGIVTRWQMALFMTRTFNVVLPLPTGASQGFEDIAMLPAEQQAAINQIRQLDITVGTSSTTYDPFGSVTRWQMAVFLTRLVSSAGVALPDGSDQGFVDIADLPAEVRTAINQVRQLGITTGTSTTTYGPDDAVTREQMASFLIRTLKRIFAWVLIPSAGYTCTPQLTDPSPTEPPRCTSNQPLVLPLGMPLALRDFWSADLPFITNLDQASFDSPDTRVEWWLDGARVGDPEKVVKRSGIAYKIYDLVLQAPAGPHTLEARSYAGGTLVLTVVTTVMVQ